MKVTIKPTPKQHEAWTKLQDKETLFVVFGGGAGGGKTWLGCEWLLTNCYFYPGSKWFIGREELKRLMTSSYLTFVKVCKYHGIPMSDWELDGKYNFIQFKNGSRIDLLDLKYLPSDPLYERFGSLEYTGGWIEEASEVNFGAFDVLKTRIARHRNKDYGIPGKMLLTCNPHKGYLYGLVYKPAREGTLRKEYAFVQSLYKDNPHTAEDYEKSLRQIQHEATKQRLMFGNWEYDDDVAKLILYDAICDLFSTKTQDSKNMFMTVDVARFGQDRAVILLWRGLQVEKIHAFERSSIDFLQEQARDLCNKYRIPRSKVIADEDGVGGGFIDNFRCKGFLGGSSPIQPPEYEYDKTKKVNYTNLRSQCYYLLADYVNQRKIGIDATEFEDLIKEELEQIKDKDADADKKRGIVSKEDIKSAIGRSPDFADALMMRMYFEIPQNRRGEPKGFSFNISYDKFGQPKIA